MYTGNEAAAVNPTEQLVTCGANWHLSRVYHTNETAKDSQICAKCH